jgi:hypothetical protein
MSALEEVMPSVSERGLQFFDEMLNSQEFVRGEASVHMQRHRIEPELSLEVISTHMDVWRLGVVTCVEEESIRSGSVRRRHEREHGPTVAALTWQEGT